MNDREFVCYKGPAAPLVVRTLERTCYAMPAQWEGRADDGRKVYARYRFGFGEVRVGVPGDGSVFAAVGGPIVCTFARVGGGLATELDGDLSESELVRTTKAFVTWPTDLKDTPKPTANDPDPDEG